MAIFFDAPVDPDALTAFAREIPTPAGLDLVNLFPIVTENDNTVDFAEIVRTNRTARYRSFDGRIHVSERDAGSEKRVRLLPLSSSLNMGEYERLQLEFARTGGTRSELLANAAYNDEDQLVREIWNRLELAWGDTLTDAVLSINENGFTAQADFGMPANHLVVPSAGLWSNTATATILADLIAWNDVYVATNGFPIGSLRTSQRVQRFMQTNEEIINAVHGATPARTRVTRDELNDLLSSEGLPTVGAPYDAQVDVDGTATRTIPDDRVVMGPANPADLGRTVFGISATALELVDSNESDMSFGEAPGIVGVIEKVGPPYRQFTFVDAVAMPILSDAKRLMVADVA